LFSLPSYQQDEDLHSIASTNARATPQHEQIDRRALLSAVADEGFVFIACV
jgi:hypothetical protein